MTTEKCRACKQSRNSAGTEFDLIQASAPLRTADGASGFHFNLCAGCYSRLANLVSTFLDPPPAAPESEAGR